MPRDCSLGQWTGRAESASIRSPVSAAANMLAAALGAECRLEQAVMDLQRPQRFKHWGAPM